MCVVCKTREHAAGGESRFYSVGINPALYNSCFLHHALKLESEVEIIILGHNIMLVELFMALGTYHKLQRARPAALGRVNTRHVAAHTRCRACVRPPHRRAAGRARKQADKRTLRLHPPLDTPPRDGTLLPRRGLHLNIIK